MNRLIQSVLLGSAMTLTGVPAAFSAEEAEGENYIEEIVVTSERGEVNVLDRAMTVTGHLNEVKEPFEGMFTQGMVGTRPTAPAAAPALAGCSRSRSRSRTSIAR